MKLFDKSSKYTPLKAAVQSSGDLEWVLTESAVGVFLVDGLIPLIVFIATGTLVVWWPIPVAFMIIGLVILVVRLGLYLKRNFFNGQTPSKYGTSYVPTVPTVSAVDHESSQDKKNLVQKNAIEPNGAFSNDGDITDELRNSSNDSQNGNCLPNNSFTHSNYASENCDITESLDANLNYEFRSLFINH